MKQRASQNRTLDCDQQEIEFYKEKLKTINEDQTIDYLKNTIINQNMFDILKFFPINSIDLLILDPPYNLSKDYNGYKFKERPKLTYSEWFEKIIEELIPTLKPTASIYICSDWRTSILIIPILEKYFYIRNRITWEREKGRGSKSNWKNNSEDIWFCTMGKKYTFNVEDVKMKKRVIAPYRKKDGTPKDWKEEKEGNFRLTHPSNLWTDITVPFWSMPENTDHPTQKPEKLIAKLILASSNENDIVLDPFLGSGTSAVVAKKLNRSFIGIESNQEYCCWSAKRLRQSFYNSSIQGYSDNVFWERNSL